MPEHAIKVLAEFINDEPSTLPPEATRALPSSPQEALKFLDDKWYSPLTRGGRWMDLIGDYAGKEPFVIDGDSLIQFVLDQPLLALGRPDDPSFQLVHALYALETLVEKFLKRDAVFDIVFWQTLQHSTLQTGSSAYVFASRYLARALLKRQLNKLPVDVYAFNDLEDPEWLAYYKRVKPMFVMLDDGGLLQQDKRPLAAERLLTRRKFIFGLLNGGVAISLLPGAQFRDSKILAFIYTSNYDPLAARRYPDALWGIAKASGAALTAKYTTYLSDVAKVSRGSTDSRNWLAGIVGAYRSSYQTLPALHPELLYAFVAHYLLLQEIGVDGRAQRLPVLPDALGHPILNEFLPRIFIIMGSASESSDVDLDGRVFASLLHFLVRTHPSSFAEIIGVEVAEKVNQIWEECGMAPINVASLLKHCASVPLVPESPTPPEDLQYALLPFTNPVLDEELADVRVSVADDSDSDGEDPHYLSFGRGVPFVDTQHWHDTRKTILPKWLGGQNPQKVAAWLHQRRMKFAQIDMKNVHRLASTLTGAQGAILQPTAIPSAKASKAQAAPSREASSKTKGKKGAPKKMTAAEKIIEENKRRKEEKIDAENLNWWQGHLADLSKLSVDAQKEYMVNLCRSNRTSQGWLSIETRLYRLHLEITQWMQQPDPKEGKVHDAYSVAVFRMVVELYRNPGLWPKAIAILDSVMVSLGLEDYIPALTTAADCHSSDRSLSFSFIKLIKSKTKSLVHKSMRVREHPVMWQLRLFGEYMDRSMDSAPDRRVSFEPDAWQRKVLDCIDENHSLLVVAPTSAGKTFISYYAMEKVLRNSDDGILVFVAPTKALVNQVAADVYARFRKDLSDRACWAVHTRDYRIHDPQKCQILVTVPEILATMLLSPAQARNWTPRIQRIILDEIHSIGQQEGGAVWEQILLLAPCPIIGLSATIGEPEVFNAWLEQVQRTHSFKHTFVHHATRYSHLRKFAYQISSSAGQEEFQGLAKYNASDRLSFLHPASLLAFGARSLPSDFSLEARDTLSLYRTLERHRDAIPDVDIDSLDPVKYLPSSRLLRQNDVLQYEAALKKTLSELMASFDVNDSHAPLLRIARDLEDPEFTRLRTVSPAILHAQPSRLAFFNNFIYLVSDLHVAGDLPAIAFNFDRHDCELLAQVLVQNLQQAESQWRRVSPEWQKKLKQFEVWIATEKQRQRTVGRMSKNKQRTEAGVDETPSQVSWESSFDPTDPSPQFSFAGNNRAYSFNELKEDLDDMVRSRTHIPEWAVQALRRGIAVHHAGMNKRYRNLVESLFRLGFVRIMIATGTLALGINAPARTSIFCGDSPFLTALMYRQCAGRAGRRGYDLLGKVVFYGIPLDRIQRLVLSKLPSLGGHFPLTSTLCLRILNLLTGSGHAEVAVKSVRALLRLPQITVKSDSGHQQVLHHVRFSIDYLRRSGLLEEDGTPMNLYSAAAHLYHTEPSNFALVVLLRAGVFHRICHDMPSVAAKREIILILCHLFQRRYLPRTFASEQYFKEITTKYPSVVKLPPLPEHARAVLVDHDQEILRVFKSYAMTYAEQHAQELSQEQCLPLSKQQFAVSDDLKSAFVRSLRETRIRSIVRSPFVCNSGHGDDFRTVPELTATASRGLHLNADAIPSMSDFTRLPREGYEYALNAHIYDFYVHGQDETLVRANKIRRGDLWYILEDFNMTLAIVKGTLGQLLTAAASGGLGAMDDMLNEELGGVDPAEANTDEAIETSWLSKDPKVDDEDSNDEEDVAQITDSLGTPVQKPKDVSELDWKVYEMINAAHAEFNEKFKAMWA
ncbi:P-loop containing nucleoside triphosphate hydrolase protein [Punctularia strigosozonata HHB-11173 SS5]|uniref:P-loop containing nucleoside triphosphate hydrolase protein n=1 Tax=Punctularia strigosozonata (strain HHB-11173) TaxID=741275 RepID=UPI000441752D|nr:P-loop containing nucleoside triphosphate hydrolase protein [Punctularia strigosozonata HHB-11173 SS5]EIN08256.1 P-loop containing nucleoside triphosphate hydrolase protein [Punctularia strigosozonata HHB-11173 SS5]